MDWFSPGPFARLNDALLDIHGATQLGDVMSRLLEHIPSLVPLSSSAAFYVGDDSWEFTHIINTDLDPRMFEMYKDYYEPHDEYKRLVFARDPVPATDRSSDYMDYRQWEMNAHRSEFLLPNGIYHLAGIQILVGSELVGDLCLHRDVNEPDFSADEMAILRVLQSHASLASRNCLVYVGSSSAGSALAAALGSDQHAVIVFDSNLRQAYRNAAAKLVCDSYRLHAGPGVRLPAILADILAHHRSVLNSARGVQPRSWTGRLHLAKHTLAYTVLETTLSTGDARYIVYLNWTGLDDQPGRAPSSPFGLSTREYEVARLVARGMSNAIIASALNVSLNTVKTHLKNLMRKTSTRSRAEMVYALFGDQNRAGLDQAPGTSDNA